VEADTEYSGTPQAKSDSEQSPPPTIEVPTASALSTM